MSSASTRPDPAFVVRLEGVTLWRSDLHRPWGSPPLEDDRALLERVSLALAPGTVAALLGPSGSGKSSLLRLCNRLERSRAGAIELLGRGVEHWPIAALRRTATLVGQSAPLLGGSVREELERPLRWAGRVPEAERLRTALATAGLEPALLERPGEQLSGGERARLALARALVLAPRLLLLDEATASLDPRLARAVLEALAEWARRSEAAVLLVTHRISDLSALADHAPVYVLDRARLRGPLSAARLAAGRVGDPEVDRLLGRLEDGPDPAQGGS